MNKYGSENFIIKILEECSCEDASQKEQFWIQKLDTYNNGYNATLGGDSKHYYNYLEIANKYKELLNITQTAKFFNCDRDTVRVACKEYNIKVLNAEEISRLANSKKVFMIDKKTNKILHNFDSITLAAQYIFDNKFSKSSDIDGIRAHIGAVCNGKRKTAYGFK